MANTTELLPLSRPNHNFVDCFMDPSYFSISVGIFIIVGTLVSYIPQYMAIVKRKSSDGINYIMLGMALLCSYLTAINSGILKWEQVICCLNLSGNKCLENNLATLQLLCGLVCYGILYILFLVYYPLVETETQTVQDRKRGKNKALAVLIIETVSAIFIGVLAGVMYYDFHFTASDISLFAKILGIVSSLLMLVQWSPQIYTTFKLKSAGSLSMAMLLLQMPGSLLVMFFQAILNSADVTTWGPYFFQFIQQLILVVMCGIFAFQARKKRQEQERAPLLEDVNLSTVRDYSRSHYA